MTPHYRKYQSDQIVIEIIQKILKKYNNKTPSYNLLLKDFGINIYRQNLPFYQDGYYSGEGKAIIINKNLSYQPRILFTIFHEITHYLIEKNEEIYEYLTDNFKENDKKFKNCLEYLCNLGAAEFLIPTSKIQDEIIKNGFSINSFKIIKRKFESSAPAFLIKFAYHSPHDCICISCIYGLSNHNINKNQKSLFNNTNHFTNNLYIDYSAKSKNFKYPLRRFTIIPKDHPINQCFQNKCDFANDSYIPFPSGKKMPAHIECYYDKGKVYAIFYKQRPTIYHGQTTLGI